MTAALSTIGAGLLVYGITGDHTPRTYAVLASIVFFVAAYARWESRHRDDLRGTWGR